MEVKNTEQVKIRQAIFADSEYLAKLSIQLGYAVSGEEVRTRLREFMEDEEHTIYVAELRDGSVVGWVHAFVHKHIYTNPMAEVGGIVVEKNYRGQGIGRKLMEKVEEWGRKKGCQSVSVRSNISRREAHVFYEKLGLNKVKEQHTFRKFFE